MPGIITGLLQAHRQKNEDDFDREYGYLRDRYMTAPDDESKLYWLHDLTAMAADRLGLPKEKGAAQRGQIPQGPQHLNVLGRIAHVFAGLNPNPKDQWKDPARWAPPGTTPQQAQPWQFVQPPDATAEQIEAEREKKAEWDAQLQNRMATDRAVTEAGVKDYLANQQQQQAIEQANQFIAEHPEMSDEDKEWYQAQARGFKPPTIPTGTSTPVQVTLPGATKPIGLNFDTRSRRFYDYTNKEFAVPADAQVTFMKGGASPYSKTMADLVTYHMNTLHEPLDVAIANAGAEYEERFQANIAALNLGNLTRRTGLDPLGTDVNLDADVATMQGQGGQGQTRTPPPQRPVTQQNPPVAGAAGAGGAAAGQPSIQQQLNDLSKGAANVQQRIRGNLAPYVAGGPPQGTAAAGQPAARGAPTATGTPAAGGRGGPGVNIPGGPIQVDGQTLYVEPGTGLTTEVKPSPFGGQPAIPTPTTPAPGPGAGVAAGAQPTAQAGGVNLRLPESTVSQVKVASSMQDPVVRYTLSYLLNLDPSKRLSPAGQRMFQQGLRAIHDITGKSQEEIQAIVAVRRGLGEGLVKNTENMAAFGRLDQRLQEMGKLLEAARNRLPDSQWPPFIERVVQRIQQNVTGNDDISALVIAANGFQKEYAQLVSNGYLSNSQTLVGASETANQSIVRWASKGQIAAQIGQIQKEATANKVGIIRNQQSLYDQMKQPFGTSERPDLPSDQVTRKPGESGLDYLRRKHGLK